MYFLKINHIHGIMSKGYYITEEFTNELLYFLGDDKMPPNYITIESVTGGVSNRVKQDLKFKTGNFVWRIKFSAPLKPSTVNNANLNVTTVNNTPLLTNIRYDTVNNYIEIEPLEPYNKNESYLLHVSDRVQSKKGQRLQNNITIQFKV